MTDTADGIAIEIIPIERITVLNPRVRDPKKFGEIVDSIENIGLKQPIKVSPAKGADGEVAYNLVYGQGRMEAFLALGQTEIPAIVTDLSEQDSLLVSLIENVARRQPRPGELFRAIGDLIERGYTNRKIAAKIGYSAEYVGSIRRLLEAGEERLLVAVETGKIPLRVAIAISVADDEQGARSTLQGLQEWRGDTQANAGSTACDRASPSLRQGAKTRSGQPKTDLYFALSGRPRPQGNDQGPLSAGQEG